MEIVPKCTIFSKEKGAFGTPFFRNPLPDISLKNFQNINKYLNQYLLW
jgi:hypothetical protein